MKNGILQHYSAEFRSGRHVLAADAEPLFDALISEPDETPLADLLVAWNEKGTTEDELFAFASIMRERMKRVNSRHQKFVDIVGTGGSKAKTFNVSTAAAFVIAGAGVPVAKHGNRAATSNSGSADALSSLGIGLDIGPADAERHLNEHGLCFMFAPHFHSLSAALAKARRSLGRPTIFNNLGPLCNPASAPHQVIGVWNKDLVEKTANVLARLGTERSWVVHNENGMDEIGLRGKTFVAEVSGDSIKRFEISANDFGADGVSGDLPSGCSVEESARLIRQVFENKVSGSDAEKLVLINVAAAIHIAGQASDLIEAYKRAEESVRGGAASEKLNKLAAETTK